MRGKVRINAPLESGETMTASNRPSSMAASGAIFMAPPVNRELQNSTKMLGPE
jgi:hypothetical protein